MNGLVVEFVSCMYVCVCVCGVYACVCTSVCTRERATDRDRNEIR